VILGAWQVLVLVGSAAAYHGFVSKGEGAVFSLLATVGIFSVCGLGALSLEAEHTTSGEWGIAILFFLAASLAALSLPVALTKSGPYAPERDDSSGKGQLEEPDSSFLDGLVGRLT